MGVGFIGGGHVDQVTLSLDLLLTSLLSRIWPRADSCSLGTEGCHGALLERHELETCREGGHFQIAHIMLWEYS